MFSRQEEEEMKSRLNLPLALHPTLGICQADGGVKQLVAAGTDVPVYPAVGTNPSAATVLAMPSYRCERCGEVTFDLVLLAAAERAIKARLEQGEEVPAAGIPFRELGVLPDEIPPATSGEP